MANPKVFISYSRKDRSYVDNLVAALRNKGMEVWFDYHLLSGQDWDDTLEEQIKTCDYMIIVLSKTSVASVNVKNELRFAMDLGKTIHPILIEECSIPLSMRRMHYVDFKSLGFEKGIYYLERDIKQNTSDSSNFNQDTTSNEEQSTAIASSEKKVTKNIKKPLILISILVLATLGIWQFWPKSNSEMDVVENDIHWQNIKESKHIDDYSNYITTHRDTEQRCKNAVNAIQNLLKDEGALVIERDELFDDFRYLVYQNNEDDYKVIDSSSIHIYTGWPKKGDLLIVQKKTSVKDPQTLVAQPGVFLNPGDIITFSGGKDAKPALLEFYYNKNDLEFKTVLSSISQNIYFQTGSPKLNLDKENPNGYKTILALNELADLLKSIPDYSLIIEGHTDSVGDGGRNLTLSEARASAVLTYIKTIQSVPNKMLSVGYGEERPIENNTTNVGRAKNRRIELKIFPPNIDINDLF